MKAKPFCDKHQCEKRISHRMIKKNEKYIPRTDLICDKCVSENRAEHYKQNKSKKNAYGKEYYKSNKNNPDFQNTRHLYYENNKDQIKQTSKMRYDNNKDDI